MIKLLCNIAGWLSHCLNEWPADWLTLYLLDNWLTILLPEWVTCWPADYLTQWMTKWLNFWLTTDLLTCRYMYTTSLIDWLSNLLANWLTDYNNWLTWWLTDSLTNKMWPLTGFLHICRNSLCSSVLWCACTPYPHLTNLLVKFHFCMTDRPISWLIAWLIGLTGCLE